MMHSKILHVASGDLWGGAEACVLQLCDGLRQRGLQVQAVVMNPGELARRLSNLEIPTIVFDESRQSSVELGRRLRQILLDYRPHVVHSHRTKENVLAAAAVTSVSVRPRLVKTVHGAPEYSNARPWSRNGIAKFIDTQCDRLFDARVAVSEELARLLRGTYRGPTWTIHNGIAEPAVPVRAATERATVPVIGFAGRFVRVKRVDLLLQTAARMKALGQTFRFELAGDGPLLESLRRQAAELQVEDVVSFVGFQSDIWTALSRWDALMLTSDHEGLPMICLESLSAGVPIIARRVGGLSEVVASSMQGLLIDSADPSVLAEGTVAFLQRLPRAQARHSLLPVGFTADAMCSSYAELYERLLDATVQRAPA